MNERMKTDSGSRTVRQGFTNLCILSLAEFSLGRKLTHPLPLQSPQNSHTILHAHSCHSPPFSPIPWLESKGSSYSRAHARRTCSMGRTGPNVICGRHIVRTGAYHIPQGRIDRHLATNHRLLDFFCSSVPGQ
jgi:hypothetical protein